MDEELVIHQKIWVSDFDNAQNHYQVNDPCNKGIITHSRTPPGFRHWLRMADPELMLGQARKYLGSCR